MRQPPHERQLSDIVLKTIKLMQSKFKSLDYKIEISPTDLIYLTLPTPRFNERKDAEKSLKRYVKSFCKILSNTLSDVVVRPLLQKGPDSLLLKVDLLGSQKVFDNFELGLSRVIISLSFSLLKESQLLDISVWSNLAVARMYNNVKFDADVIKATQLYCDEVLFACNAISKAVRLTEIE